MAGLYDQVNGFLNNDDVVDALTDEFGLDTILATRTGLALAVPTVFANLSDWLADPASDNWYRVAVRMIDPDSLANFLLLTKAPDFDQLGRQGLQTLLGHRRNDVIQRVAGRADIPAAAADGIMSATAWAMTAFLTRSYSQHYNRLETAGLLAGEYHALIDQGWGPWLRDVTPIAQEDGGSVGVRVTTSQEYYASDLEPLPRRQPLAVPHYSGRAEEPRTQTGQYERAGYAGEAIRDQPPPSSGSRVWIYLAGILGTLLVLALLGGAFLLGRLNPEDGAEANVAVADDPDQETDSQAGETADPDADQIQSGDDQGDQDQGDQDGDETITVDQSDQPQDGGSGSGSGSAADDVDRWPGGRGPVPDTPPARRTLQVDQDGTLLLTGSAPNWEVAMQVLMVAEENYPLDGVAITNELTWHPDAASSIRSGDVVMPQAAMFDTGAATISDESLPTLDLAASILLSTPTVYVVVTGHADAQGDDAVNVSLASDRVAATVEYLLGQGVIPGQIVTASAGEDDPAASNDTSEGRRSNRRVELLFKNYLATSLRSGS